MPSSIFGPWFVTSIRTLSWQGLYQTWIGTAGVAIAGISIRASVQYGSIQTRCGPGLVDFGSTKSLCILRWKGRLWIFTRERIRGQSWGTGVLSGGSSRGLVIGPRWRRKSPSLGGYLG